MEQLTFYPWHGEPFLAFYGGAYDRAFVALHPFYAIAGHHPRDFSSRTFHVDFSNLGAELSGPQLLAAADEAAARHRAGKLDPARADALAKRDGRMMSWEQVGRDTGFDTLGAINCALCSGIGGLQTEFADPDGAALLKRCCDDNAVFMPSEGCFQAVMERSVAKLFRNAGVDAMEAAAEFDQAGQQLPPGMLDSDEPWEAASWWPRCTRRLFAADRSLLVLVDWDSFFTLICGQAERFARVHMADLFDGFWCDAATSHSWWQEQPRGLGRGEVPGP